MTNNIKLATAGYFSKNEIISMNTGYYFIVVSTPRVWYKRLHRFLFKKSDKYPEFEYIIKEYKYD